MDPSNRTQIRPPPRNRTVSANNANNKPIAAARKAFKPRRSEPLKGSVGNVNGVQPAAPKPAAAAVAAAVSPATTSSFAIKSDKENTPTKTQHSQLTQTTPSQTPRKEIHESTPIYSPLAPSDSTTRSPLQSSLSPTNALLTDMTQRTLAPISVADSGWELETADNDPNALDEDFQNTLDTLSIQHSQTIVTYKRLLESCQNSSAAQLYALQTEVNDLRNGMHSLETENRRMKLDRRTGVDDTVSISNLSTLLRPNFDEVEVKKAIKQLQQDERLRLVRVVLEGVLPHDISTTIRMLEQYAASAFDVLGTLPENIAIQILSHLDVREALGCRLVSKRWNDMMAMPGLWRSFALRLTASDPDPLSPPERDEGWFPLYRALHFRERNWRTGQAQSIRFMRGHTGYVTSMQLKGGTLVTGSYDQTLRIWDMESAECTSILQAKAISCLDYLPRHKVLAAGYFDVGRVCLWSTLTNQQLQMLQGHNKGIRAVACNDEFLVSAGQDKALVVWNWRNGNRIARFGQQTNVSIGVQLIDTDKFIAVTVDSIVRCFSITKREMTSQYRLSSLVPELGSIGYTSETNLTWFGADGLSMTCATKNHLIHLEWEEGEEEVAVGVPQPPAQTQTQGNQLAPPAVPRSLKPRTSGISVNAGVTNGRGPRKSHTTTAPHPPIPQRKNSAATTASNADEAVSEANSATSNASGGVSAGTTSPAPLPTVRRKAPILTRPPKVVQITHTQNMAPVGATDVSKHRVVTSTRFSSRTGADRRLFCSTLGQTVPIEGVWSEHSSRAEDVGAENAKDSLASSNRGPLSICVDHQQAVFGCADGTVYALSFVGENYGVNPAKPVNTPNTPTNSDTH
ncbi:hypothetical protein E3P99_00242 [Wallemia hederae]|uniref:F-box domain-containing protein n=1 Tax=Wallemia hederae TaxID=1540922 RepID=A0A4T0FZ73_9BASI|nr:hypothetical protein E3P99_00242 [Wallemia hederae]